MTSCVRKAKFTEKGLDALRKKDLGTRYIVMQKRARKIQACKIKKSM